MLTTRTAAKAKLVGAVAIVAALAVIAAAPTASAAPATTQRATNTCWKTVVNDWLNNQPNLKGTYPIPCYTQAIQHLNAYPDIKQYSSAIDDIHRAELNARQKGSGAGLGSGGGGGGGSTPGGSGPTGGTGGGAGNSNNSTGGGTAATHRSIINRLAADIGPGNAQTIPLPLLVLGGLALLLLLAAAATWLARHLQARRVAPAPAIAKRR